jgi:OOP family OmpA-OmpF porin
MKYSFTILIFIAFLASALGQHSGDGERNLVPNPGFEEFSATPIGWFYKGEHFTRVMKYWSSPTGASPDVFGPKVRVPSHWQEKDFGKQPPRSGGAMAGLTLFGCKDGKPHCREYIQIQLAEPLVPGQEYQVEMWVNHLPRSILVNNLGFYFNDQAIHLKTDELLEFEPQVKTDDIVQASYNKWKSISGRFIAESAAEFMIIGNFSDDAHTQTRQHRSDNLKYGYYYIDDVLVKKVPPILPVPLEVDDLSNLEIEVGKVVKLSNIYFEFDKWDLHPRSFIELNKLLKLMKDNPGMVIQINGHTDNRGEDNYNMYLSRKRAKSVAYYLNDNGIDRSRTLYKGYGSTEPVATNSTDEGRQLNRRVEFVILKK